jgi:beta-glucanase (GH16 family)
MYWPFNEPHYIILNLAIGGTMGGSIDDSMFEHGDVLMKVDWVKVWQREEQE